MLMGSTIRNLFALVTIMFVLSLPQALAIDCSGAESEAYDGYRDAKRAYRASTLKKCRSYARKAYRHASYAESHANSCGCSGAESEAYDGYRDAKRAYRASTLKKCRSYARKAYRHLSYAESEANYCD